LKSTPKGLFYTQPGSLGSLSFGEGRVRMYFLANIIANAKEYSLSSFYVRLRKNEFHRQKGINPSD
jgi:hypothetical protein